MDQHTAATPATSGVIRPVVAGCDVGQVAGAPCPVCDGPLMQEHAHTRCRACGWLGKCCE